MFAIRIFRFRIVAFLLGTRLRNTLLLFLRAKKLLDVDDRANVELFILN